MTCGQEFDILEDGCGWAIGHDLPLVNDNGSLAEVEDHVEIVGGNQAGVTEIPQLIAQMRWGEICGLLEDATDRAEDVADVLEGIYLKNG